MTEQDPSREARISSNSRVTAYESDQMRDADGRPFYDAGLSLGRNQEFPGEQSLVVYRNGKTETFTNFSGLQDVRAEVDRQLAGALPGGISPAEKVALDYTIDDLLDNRRLDGSVPRPRGGNSR